ncbi:hypothetical protein ACSBR1_017501 [Camellia fascicularis]
MWWFMPGLNTLIRELVCSLYHMYGATKVLGIDGGYRGFYSRNSITLTPNVVNDIHKCGGTIIGASRGGHNTSKIVDSIQDCGINQVYIIGGDGTQKGAVAIFQQIRNQQPSEAWHKSREQLQTEANRGIVMDFRARQPEHASFIIRNRAEAVCGFACNLLLS